MNIKQTSVLHSVAEYYYRDACDFAERFDILWERQLHKTGRIKSFVDLLMACECALKSHVALGRVTDNPDKVYACIRNAGHRIDRLVAEAKFLSDRSVYENLEQRLREFSVLIRYSLEAYETFFPSCLELHDAKLNYSKSIGNNGWVHEIRGLLDTLLNSATDSFSGFVTDDIEAIFECEAQIKKLTDGISKKKA